MTTPGQADPEISISWSRLKDWEECSERGYLLSRGFRSPVTDLRVFFKGTVVDRCMRKWLDLPDPPLGWMAEHVDLIFETEEREARETGDGIVGWKHPGDKAELREWCRRCVTRLEPTLVRYALPYYYEPAKRFRVPLKLPPGTGPSQVILNGEMDLLTMERSPAPDMTGPRRLRVWDLKATENKNYYQKVIGQLVFYDIACFAMFREWPLEVGIFQPMCEEPELPFTLTMNHRREMLARIERVAIQMWNKQHSPKVSNAGCDWCPVHHACPKFALNQRGKAPFV